MIIEKKIKINMDVEKELSNLQEEINVCKFPLKKASLLLEKVRLLRLQELKRFTNGINYKRIIEDLNNYIEAKK